MNCSPRFSGFLHVVLPLLLLAMANLAPAAEQNVAPGINRSYQDPDYEQWVTRFESPGREVYDQRQRIVDALKLASGMRVADIGAGTGLYTVLFAEKVGPQGKVYAVDISENFINNIVRRSEKQGLNNVEGIVNTQQDTKLKPGSVDLVFMSDTYHHFEYPRAMLRSIRQALKPGGRMAIIDFRKEPGVSSGWVMSHVRADKQTVIKEVEASGFHLTQEPGFLRDNYFLLFTREN